MRGLDPRAARRRATIAPCKFGVRLVDRAPRALPRTRPRASTSASWTAVGQPAAVALERQPRRLDLERGAQLVELRRSPRRVRRATRAPRLGSTRTSPSAASVAQRGAQRVARDAVARASAPARPAARPPGRSPSRISCAQRVGDGLDRGHAGTVAGGGGSSGAASTSRPARISAAAERRGRGHPLAEHDHAQQRGRQRLGERQRRGLGGAEHGAGRGRTAGRRRAVGTMPRNSDQRGAAGRARGQPRR